MPPYTFPAHLVHKQRSGHNRTRSGTKAKDVHTIRDVTTVLVAPVPYHGADTPVERKPSDHPSGNIAHIEARTAAPCYVTVTQFVTDLRNTTHAATQRKPSATPGACAGRPNGGTR